MRPENRQPESERMSKTYKIPKLEDLLHAGVHFGHQTRRWHPNMEEYIYTQRMGIHVIDLEKTQTALENACEFLYETAKNGGQIVIVGTKKQASELVKNEATKCGALYVNQRWLGGTITNFSVIKASANKLVELLRKKNAGDFDKYTKKERLMLDRQIDKLQLSVGGIVELKGAPAAVVVVDGRREKTAIKEANARGISVVGIIDTNTNPEGIDYVIPGNDDAVRSLVALLQPLSDAIEAGYKEFEKMGGKSVFSTPQSDEEEKTKDEIPDVEVELENSVEEEEVEKVEKKSKKKEDSEEE